MECTFTPEVKVDGMYLYARGHSWWNVPLSIFGFFFKGFFKKTSERWRARLTMESASSSKDRINSNYSNWAILISEVKGWLLDTSEYCQHFGWCHAPYYFRNSGCVFAFLVFSNVLIITQITIKKTPNTVLSATWYTLPKLILKLKWNLDTSLTFYISMNYIFAV